MSLQKYINEKEQKKLKVFLGGTWNNSTWRDELISMLKIEYFNPIVKDWTLECMEEEIKQRKLCDYVLYVITKEMIGVYSIAEVVDDSNKQPEKTLFCFIEDGFEKAQIKSLNQVSKMINNNSGRCFISLDEIANFLNEQVND